MYYIVYPKYFNKKFPLLLLLLLLLSSASAIKNGITQKLCRINVIVVYVLLFK